LRIPYFVARIFIAGDVLQARDDFLFF